MYKGVWLLLFLMPLLSGCSHDSIADSATTDNQPAAAEAYVSVTLSMEQGTRTSQTYPTYNTSQASPNGGEAGDGPEPGQSYENVITSLRVFFFSESADSKGVNAPAETPVAATADFGYLSPVGTAYTTGVRKVALPAGTYDVVAVANVATDGLGDITTLGQLRDCIQTTAWRQVGSSYGEFVMASAEDASIEITTSNAIDNPAMGEITVERHAARVDYKTKESYTCADTDVKDATVEIVGAGLVNNLTAGTYMLKRVAGTVGGEVDYLGKETADADNVATNYVIDPWTAEKTPGNEDSEDMERLYGLRFNASDMAAFWDTKITNGTLLPGDEGWKTAGYTMENTTAAAYSSRLYNTAMVFKAKFHPTADLVQSLYKANMTYKDGNTFFRWGTQLFADMESVYISFLNSNSPASKLDDIISNIEGSADLSGLTAVINGLPDNDPVGYKKYLTELVKTTGESFEAIKAKAAWQAFMLSEYGYANTTADSDTNVSVTINGNDRHTRKLLLPFGVSVYENAVCYYTWWLRHSNDNDDTVNGIMEFATVRNNIYKLEVESVAGIGSPIPPEDDENIQVRAYVHSWTMLPAENMSM